MPTTPLPTTPPAAPSFTPTQALNNFANSAGMQFQLEQGANTLNNLYAGRGMLQSGAALKALQDYGQQTALQNYFMPYMNYLGGQQGAGIQAGSSIAGVGVNAANTNAGISSGMGNAIGSGAANLGNLALAGGMNQANMWNSIGGALGNFGSSFFPTR